MNERIIFLRNHKDLGVFNGQTGIVTGVDKNRLTIRTPGRTVVVDTGKYNYLDHFYACTTWKSEGDSYKYVLLNIDTWQHRVNSVQDFYVKISRAEKNLFIFTDDRRFLFAGVSRSSLDIEAKPDQIMDNRFSRLSSGIRRHLLQASQHYLQYEHLKDSPCPHFQFS